MKIVIDMPEEDYKDIIDGYAYQELADELIKYVKEGTPLPKGHGDLVDRNELFTEYPEIAIEPYINIPTVIEADKCTIHQN